MYEAMQLIHYVNKDTNTHFIIYFEMRSRFNIYTPITHHIQNIKVQFDYSPITRI